MKRVLCIQDLSAVGRSSMAAALPVLSAMGHQCCPLPVAVYSSHTGGFDPVVKMDGTDFLAGAADAYRQQEIDFDCIYTGYLCSPRQVELAREFVKSSKAGLKITDTAMADNGRLYSGLDEGIVEAMRGLCREADLIIPNPTEAALLTGSPMQDKYTAEQAQALCTLTAETFGCSVIITGLPLEDGSRICIGQGKAGWERFSLQCGRYVDASYPGTGDLFGAVLTGALLRGNALQSAAELAMRFTENAVRATYAAGTEPRFGVEFEPMLGELVPRREEQRWR